MTDGNEESGYSTSSSDDGSFYFARFSTWWKTGEEKMNCIDKVEAFDDNRAAERSVKADLINDGTTAQVWNISKKIQ